MNKNKYLKLRLWLFIKGVLFSILAFFLSRKSNRIIFNSEFNTEFNHNSKYLFLYFLENHPELDIRFVINDSILYAELEKEFGPYFIDTHSLKNCLYILKAKVWVTSSLETPISGVYQAYRRKVFHLGHGSPLKKVGLGEEYVNWKKSLYYRLIKGNFSYFFSTSEAFSETWRKCLDLEKDQVLITGQARNEALNTEYISRSESFEFNPTKKHILYAPTWRPFSDTILFPFEDFNTERLGAFLQQYNYVIHLRVHPNFESDISDSIKSIEGVNILPRSNVVDINEVLGKFDLLITDYSSIYIDYLLTQKPLLFLPYDHDLYKEKIGFSIPYDKATPGPKPKTQIKFLSEVKELLVNSEYYAQERKMTNDWLNSIQSQPAKRNAELIMREMM